MTDPGLGDVGTAIPPAAAGEPTEHDLEQSLRTEWFVLALLVLVPVALLVVAAAASGGAAATAVAVVASAGLVAATWMGVSSMHRRWRYLVWDDAIEVRHGVIRHVATFVPFHRIQQIDVERGPLDRAFGLATLVIRSAAATTDAKIPGIDPGVVEDLRAALLARADLDDAV